MQSLDSRLESISRKSPLIAAISLQLGPISHRLKAIGLVVLIAIVGCGPPPQADNKPQAARGVGSVKLNEGQKQKLKKNLDEIRAGSGKNAESKQQDLNSDTEPKIEEKDPSSDSNNSDNESDSSRFVPNPPEEHTIDIPEHWKRLSKNEVWADFKEKKVILGGYICMNMGPLEMFACPEGTKEHESVVGAKALASEMHAALLAIGAKPGAPCSWDDTSFTTPSGSIINIELRWKDETTNEVITRPAKEMLKHAKTDKELKLDWVFGGSRFYEDPDTQEKFYIANSGEMICVSNFSTAAIDLNIPSSQINDSLMFLANPDKIPPKGTKVYLILSAGEFLEAKREPFPDQEQQPVPQTDAQPNAQPNVPPEAPLDEKAKSVVMPPAEKEAGLESDKTKESPTPAPNPSGTPNEPEPTSSGGVQSPDKPPANQPSSNND